MCKCIFKDPFKEVHELFLFFCGYAVKCCFFQFFECRLCQIRVRFPFFCHENMIAPAVAVEHAAFYKIHLFHAVQQCSQRAGFDMTALRDVLLAGAVMISQIVQYLWLAAGQVGVLKPGEKFLLKERLLRHDKVVKRIFHF